MLLFMDDVIYLESIIYRTPNRFKSCFKLIEIVGLKYLVKELFASSTVVLTEKPWIYSDGGLTCFLYLDDSKDIIIEYDHSCFG